MSILEALELPVDMFALCVKNQTIHTLMQSEEGRKYLDDCNRFRVTTMDIDGLNRLRAQLGGVNDGGT